MEQASLRRVHMTFAVSVIPHFGIDVAPRSAPGRNRTEERGPHPDDMAG